jgi:UTP--glucose-1-phosphate uridylyltransferase
MSATVRVILNGGLGTSMGLTGTKSLLDVKGGKSFLDIIVKQVRLAGAALAIMNSFNTHEDTCEALKQIDPQGASYLFLQHKFPKILQESLAPAVWPQNPAFEWNPPGHGDVYSALYASGMLKSLLDQGIVYAFISNSDNLGAGIDPEILGYFANNRFPFMMEVAQKTPADVKGGHLARLKSGQLVLRESAQCPEGDIDSFLDTDRHRFFNTNNVWINLEYLQTLLENNQAILLPMILNPKTLDPRDEKSPAVFQVESAMGSAISLFEGAAALEVPRSRFFPVKKCDDLLAVRSDLFEMKDTGQLIISPKRNIDGRPETIYIRLDPAFYGHIDKFNERFGAGVPSLIDCESLTIEGDVRFENAVTFSGQVRIKNISGRQAVVKSGSHIEGDLSFT